MYEHEQESWGFTLLACFSSSLASFFSYLCLLSPNWTRAPVLHIKHRGSQIKVTPSRHVLRLQYIDIYSAESQAGCNHTVSPELPEWSRADKLADMQQLSGSLSPVKSCEGLGCGHWGAMLNHPWDIWTSNSWGNCSLKPLNEKEKRELDFSRVMVGKKPIYNWFFFFSLSASSMRLQKCSFRVHMWGWNSHNHGCVDSSWHEMFCRQSAANVLLISNSAE